MKKKVLIESNKMMTQDNDGVKRYLVELLQALSIIVLQPNSEWEVDLYYDGKIQALSSCQDIISRSFQPELRDNAVGEKAYLSSAHLIKNSFRNFVKSKLINSTHPVSKSIYYLILQARLFSNILGELLDAKFRFSSYDIIHISLPQNYQPFRRSNTKRLVTVHDLTHIIYPEYHTLGNIKMSELGLKDAIAKQADFIAISQSTKNDLLRTMPVDKAKVHLVYEAADSNKFDLKNDKAECSRIIEKYGIDPALPYIICLSTIEPRKNLKNTIAAYIEFINKYPDVEIQLVIAGKKGWSFNDVFEAAEACSGKIVFTGFVADEDLPYLYSSATAMSYLSFYEGFGLPPLEAMCCGTPVIFGNNSSLIEIVGKGGLPANPQCIDDIVKQFAAIICNGELREEKNRMALEQSQRFSWADTAFNTLNLYEQLLNDS